ncbi:MAG: SDR family NAD(P)-dependent oxidoreductase [Actinobacteria bacterium]|nr:SDR family NAD(P)-dependent oxidoreductase [Actinomycetota bacterium]
MADDPSPSFADRYGPWGLVLGASHGIGNAFAHELAARGVSVVMAARPDDGLDAAADAVRAAHGVEVRTVEVDLIADDMIGRLAPATADLDIGLLACVAGGVDSVGRFLDHPAERAERLVRLNCLAPIRACHHYGSHLRARGRGGIVLISSLAGVFGTDGTVAYSAAKSFDLVLAQGLWAELRPHGVDVIGLVLGNVRTPTLLASGLRHDPDTFPGMEPDEVARVGLDRLGEAPMWVVGDDNRMIYETLRTLPAVDGIDAMSAGVRAQYGWD